MATAESAPANGAARPFQFTLQQLFWLMAIVCLLGGAYSWLGTAVVGVLLGFACIGALVLIVYLTATRRPFEALVLTIGTCALLGFVMSAIPIARETPRSVVCAHRLKNISIALMQYESAHGTLPPPYIADANGKPMHSWRVLILPYLERDDLYQRYDFSEPWDGPNNSKLHNESLKIFCCPSCSRGQPKTETNYVAVVDPKTMWPPGKRMSLATVAQADGTANTIMLVEVHGSGIHWMEPRDLDFSTMPMTVNPQIGLGISSPHPQSQTRGLGANVVFADRYSTWLDNDTPPETIRAILTANGREKVELP